MLILSYDPRPALSPRRLLWREFLLRPEHFMGKYLVGWLLGVPVIVLVLIYIVFHH